MQIAGDRIYQLVPNAEDILNLEPEELAEIVLDALNSERLDAYHRHDFALHDTVEKYPRQYRKDILKVLMEGWMWLEREGFLIPDPEREGWHIISRRGQAMTSRSDLGAYRHANLLPKGLLHPVIAQKVWASFLRGDYETAVFQAFKEVEIAVRRVGQFSPKDVGVVLTRSAFKTASNGPAGPLTDQKLTFAEQEAELALFSGAIGWFKNPGSHREVQIEASVAVEAICLASYLMREVESRERADSLPP